MHTIMIFGNGHIGQLMAQIFSQSTHYKVILVDAKKPNTQKIQTIQCDIQQPDDWGKIHALGPIDAFVSALPHHCNQIIIDQATKHQIHYFDLSESEIIRDYAWQQSHNAQNLYMPQCGIAPGLINIITYDLLKKMDNPTDINIRVGALPQQPNPQSQLKYAHTWSLDGVIEEYARPASTITHGKSEQRPALGDYEQICIMDQNYEAFNTSGGIGSLIHNLPKSIQSCNYKTLRYPGHHRAMTLLLQELNLQEKPEVLIQILEENIPTTQNDHVICQVTIHEKSPTTTTTLSWSKAYHPIKKFNRKWSAIQNITATAACAMIDCVLSHPQQYRGLITHDQITLDQIRNNPFGHALI